MRRACSIIGGLLLGALWLGPLPRLAGEAFSAHMAMHMGVVAVAAAFLAIGLAGSRLDPASRWPRVFAPIPASIFELVVVWAWHAPGLHAFARGSTAGLVVEQGSFLAAGLWLWLSAFGGMRAADRLGAKAAAASSRRRRAAGVAGLLLTSMHMTLLGALLALTPRALYPHMAGAAGLTALEDQHLGGAIMLLVGGAAYLAGGLYLTAGLLRGSATDTPRGTALGDGVVLRGPETHDGMLRGPEKHDGMLRGPETDDGGKVTCASEGAT